MDREKKVQEVLQLAERLCMHVDHGIPPEAAEVEALRALIQELKAPPESR